MQAELHRNENAGGRTTITLERLPDGSLQLFYYDIGEDAARAFGDSDYEAWLTIPPDEHSKLAFALLVERYRGNPKALSDLQAFCREHGIAGAGGTWT